MTAVIHHGPPGSYKTFALVQRVLIPALQAGRVVVTNIRGFNDVDRVRQSMGISIPDSAQIFYLEPNTEGYDNIARFFHWVPAGALICMDEGQRVYPMRHKGFSHLDQPDDIPILDAANQPLVDAVTGLYVMRPATLEIAIDQHRHYNWDIYISTPNIAKIHGEIRKCVEWAYRHRDNSGLLPWLKNTWSEFRHDSEQSGKSIAHYSGAPKRYKADKRIFGCYQSTATGATKATNENISIFRDTKLRMALALFLASVTYIFYAFGDAYDRVVHAGQEPSEKAVSVSPSNIPQVARVSGDPVNRRDGDKVASPDDPPLNPFEGVRIYFTGTINTAMFFELEFPDGKTVPINQHELQSFGYRFKQRFGAFVAFDLHGRTVYAFPKPRAPIVERGASIERNATQLSASVL
jgi:zona occludens toxin